MRRLRAFVRRRSGTVAAVLFLVAGTAGFWRVEDTRDDFERSARAEAIERAADARAVALERENDRRRVDIATCLAVNKAVGAIEGNRDILLSFGDPTDPRAVKYRRDTDAQIAAARQDCDALPRPGPIGDQP